MADAFSRFPPNLESPGHSAEAIVPNDSTDLPNATRTIWVGTTGNIRVDLVDTTDVTFSNVPVGFFPIRATRVYATNTTADNLVAVW